MAYPAKRKPVSLIVASMVAITAVMVFISPVKKNIQTWQVDRQTDKTIPTQSRPNILLIMVDDLGYAELGAYGSEINTPAIDSLAEAGVRYTSFYAHSNCSPSRAMLFSGMDSHLAGLGAMHGYQGSNQKGLPGYEGHINQRTVSLVNLLQDTGYMTFMAGKWHLGNTQETLPGQQGFDRYFIQVTGAPPGGHFNLNGAKADSKGAYIEDGIDRTGMSVSNDFFSSNFYTDKLIEYLNLANTGDSPFFAYLAFSAPHIPVQAPDSHIDLYRGKYNEGYDVIRQRRLENMRRLGIVNKKVALSRRSPTVTAWAELTKDEQRNYARRMEVYAGAIDNIDDNVGRILEQLKDSGKLENTLVLLMSDNGAAGFNGWQSSALIERYNNANNRYDNLGRDGSMMFYGPGWASAGSTPFYLFKRHMSEGGIRVPFIISGKGIVSDQGAKTSGTILHELVTIRDIAPTLLQLAGVKYPENIYKGRKILAQTGKSFAPQLANQQTVIHNSTEVFGWELFKRRAVRKGDWKIVWLDLPFGLNQWQLYNLATDPGETQNLAQKKPEKMSEMITAWNEYVSQNNVVISNDPLAFP